MKIVLGRNTIPLHRERTLCMQNLLITAAVVSVLFAGSLSAQAAGSTMWAPSHYLHLDTNRNGVLANNELRPRFGVKKRDTHPPSMETYRHTTERVRAKP